MIRVLHVIWNLAGGGAERVVLDLCRRAPPGIACTVQPIAPGGGLAAGFAAAGVAVLPPVLRGRRVGPGTLARLHAVVRRHDVVHTHLWAGDTWGRLAGRMARRPVLTTEHNARPDASWRGVVSQLMAPLSDRVVFVSAAAAAAAGVRPGHRQVVPNGVDLGHHVPSPLPKGLPPRVLFLGRLVPQKGPDILLDALTIMRGPAGLEVRIVGEGPMRARLASHPAVRSGRVVLHDWLADPREHLAWCSLVVMPSRWEGFGLVAVEALATGRPVLASNVDALPDVVGDGGWGVAPEDPAALARALSAVLADPAGIRERATRGPGLARRFTLDAMVASYAEVWRELHSGRGGAYNARDA